MHGQSYPLIFTKEIKDKKIEITIKNTTDMIKT